ncbi:unnamed protein product [Rangifer tarandus platyrhynchus]|uniref:Uncharacterized protein n=1 Tax=Rangifer tarandus platyrhynchus TaxID=3082113 RepID=A0ABN8Y8Q3_RANTA|nr:unnamed protein product [Rangifer tarandus platyrhynchus]
MQLAGVQGPLSALHLTLATTGRTELGAPCKLAGTPFLLRCPSSTSIDKVSILPDGEESGSIIEAVKGGMEHTGSSLVTVLLAVHRTPFPFSRCHSCRGPLPGPEPSCSMGLSPSRAALGSAVGAVCPSSLQAQETKNAARRKAQTSALHMPLKPPPAALTLTLP